MNYRIFPPDEMLEARITLPLSKSISNRLLIIDALTTGSPTTTVLADCDDTHRMAGALKSDQREINIGGAGTAMRFLTAYYASRPGSRVVLDGDERMRQRPIGTLVEALRHLGADIAYTGDEGFPPLDITGKPLRGGELEIDSQVSSQFISAIAMIAPTMESPLTIKLAGDSISLPYIRMTLGLMKRHGIDCEYYDNTITVNPGTYQPDASPVEGDWSAASYWYEIAALSAGMVTLDGLESESLQGDAHVAKIFEQLGINTDYEGEEGGIDLVPSPDKLPRLNLDMGDYPDLVPAVAITAAMLGIPFNLSRLGSLRIKESDRAAALVAELDKLGFIVTCENNTLSWESLRHPIAELPVFDTHGDHRMAMALAPVALFVPGIVIKDAEVTDKSYPDFWEHLKSAGFRLLDGDTPMPTDDDEENDTNED